MHVSVYLLLFVCLPLFNTFSLTLLLNLVNKDSESESSVQEAAMKEYHL